MKKKVLILLSCCLSVALVWKGYDKCVDGFFLYRTTPPHHLNISSYKANKAAFSTIESTLNQPFYYLSSGSQAFVFISADHQLILKLFKHYRWKTPFYAAWIPHSPQKKLDGLLATYQSCLFCMHQFQEESALLYLQLTPSQEIHKTLTLYNRLGKKYTLPLETTSFILQKYATPVAQHLLELKQQHNHSQARNAIDSLFRNLLQKRYKGFTDKDPNFLNNFGFVGDQAVSIDVGGLVHDPRKDTLYFCNQELKKVSKTLLPWLKKYYPELLPYTEQIIQETKEHLSQKIKNSQL